MGKPAVGTHTYALDTGGSRLRYQLTILSVGANESEYRITREGTKQVSYITYAAQSDGLYQVGSGYRGVVVSSCKQSPPVPLYYWHVRLHQAWRVASACRQATGNSETQEYRYEVSNVASKGSQRYIVVVEHSATVGASGDACVRTYRFDTAHGLLLDEVADCPGIHQHRWLVTT